jgi:hypothetical protein
MNSEISPSTLEETLSEFSNRELQKIAVAIPAVAFFLLKKSNFYKSFIELSWIQVLVISKMTQINITYGLEILS